MSDQKTACVQGELMRGLSCKAVVGIQFLKTV